MRPMSNPRMAWRSPPNRCSMKKKCRWRSWGLGSNGTEKALKPLRACFVLASSPRLAAQARHFRRTYCDCRPSPQFLQNANDRWETQNQLFSAQSREFCCDPNRQPSLSAFSVPMLPKPQEPGAEGDYYGNVQKEATFRTMWQVNAEAKEPGQPGRAKIACRKISEDEPFATVHAEIDFSADLIAFSESASDSASHGGALEAKVVAVAKRHGSQPFMRNLTDSVTGRARDVRLAANGLVERGIIRPTGQTKCGGPLMLHRDFCPDTLPDAL